MRFLRIVAAVVVGLVAGAAAQAQGPIDFEALAPGTVVTNQYSGVTFSVPGGGTGANATIGQTAAGNGQINTTSSGSRFLKGVAYFGDIPIALRMQFSSLQRRVSFKTGAPRNIPLTITVEAFDNAGAIIAALTRTITVSAADTGEIDLPVSLTSASQNIRTVWIYTVRDGAGGEAPVLDDLAFCTTLDTSDPIVSLTAPPDLSCVCPGSTVIFEGTLDAGLCGGHASDLLQYRSIDDTTWTTISGPFFGLPNGGDSFTGTLYSWLVPASLPGGWYYFRSKMYNDAGRSDSDVVILYVDRTPPSIGNDSPPTNSVVRSTVCLLGQVTDQCGFTLTAGYRPTGGGAYLPIATGAPWPNLAFWPTGSLADGTYNVRLGVVDPCGNAGELVRNYIVDNTPPVARITSPTPCSVVGGLVTVRGEISDLHLASWVLEYTGGTVIGWTTIATGNTPVLPGGVIGVWDTRALPNCAYTLRLRATDSASNNCGSGGNVREALVSVDAGCAADFNRNGSLSVQDIFDFLAAYFAGCP